jgi:crotonobetainyl-CoA:carnitine CoA-transferase CaiB-like acyl-CoA transferase
MMPLSGVRVLDLTNVLAGPFCCYQLGRLGAEVVKIENPRGGDLARQLGADVDLSRRHMGLSFVAANAGKRSVAIDLKHPRGREVFMRLVETADAVVENFRPGVMDRLGLGQQVLRARNPSLVYCAISGFGQSGPWADRPAYDQIVQGLSGVMSVTGDARSAPLRVGYPVCDTMGGMTAAFAICAALVDQRRTGKGRYIDVSLLESTLASLGWVVGNYLNAGRVPVPMGNENATAVPSGTFRTGDGLLNVSANEQKQWEALCDVLGAPELRADPRFADRHARLQHRALLGVLLEERLAARGASEWERILNARGIPAGQVLGVDRVLAEEQVAGRGFVEAIPVPDAPEGTLRVTRPGFLLEEPFQPPESPPRLGADTRAVLGAVGLAEAEIDALEAAGAVGAPRPRGKR